jgi:hypothetical protein
MTKKQQRTAVIGILTGWAILFAVVAIFKIKVLVPMLPVLLVFALGIWMWRTVDTLHEVNKSNKPKKPKVQKNDH